MADRNRFLPDRVNVAAQIRQKIDALLQRRGEVIEAEGAEIQKINGELEELQARKIREKKAGEFDKYCMLVLFEKAARRDLREHWESLRAVRTLIKEGESNAVLGGLYEYMRQLDRDFLYAAGAGQDTEEICREYAERIAEAEEVEREWRNFIHAGYSGGEELRRDPVAQARIQEIMNSKGRKDINDG